MPDYKTDDFFTIRWFQQMKQTEWHWTRLILEEYRDTIQSKDKFNEEIQKGNFDVLNTKGQEILTTYMYHHDLAFHSKWLRVKRHFSAYYPGYLMTFIFFSFLAFFVYDYLNNPKVFTMPEITVVQLVAIILGVMALTLLAASTAIGNMTFGKMSMNLLLVLLGLYVVTNASDLSYFIVETFGIEGVSALILVTAIIVVTLPVFYLVNKRR